MGPLINKAQHEKVTGYIAIGKAEGATLHHGGGVPALQGFEGGFFVEPTIFTGRARTKCALRARKSSVL